MKIVMSLKPENKSLNKQLNHKGNCPNIFFSCNNTKNKIPNFEIKLNKVSTRIIWLLFLPHKTKNKNNVLEITLVVFSWRKSNSYWSWSNVCLGNDSLWLLLTLAKSFRELLRFDPRHLQWSKNKSLTAAQTISMNRNKRYKQKITNLC